MWLANQSWTAKNTYSVCARVCVCGVGHMTMSDTLMWLKTHGTTVDNTCLVTSMLNRGQTVVLTGILTMCSLCLCCYFCLLEPSNTIPLSNLITVEISDHCLCFTASMSQMGRPVTFGGTIFAIHFWKADILGFMKQSVWPMMCWSSSSHLLAMGCTPVTYQPSACKPFPYIADQILWSTGLGSWLYVGQSQWNEVWCNLYQQSLCQHASMNLKQTHFLSTIVRREHYVSRLVVCPSIHVSICLSMCPSICLLSIITYFMRHAISILNGRIWMKYSPRACALLKRFTGSVSKMLKQIAGNSLPCAEHCGCKVN